MSSNTASLLHFHARRRDPDKNPAATHPADSYADLIDLPYPSPPSAENPRPRLPMSERAAEFAPFAALTGYHESINQVSQNSADTTAPQIIADPDHLPNEAENSPGVDYFDADFNQ